LQRIGSEDLLIHCLKVNQLSAAALDLLNGLYYVVRKERLDPSGTPGGLTDTVLNTKIPIISDNDL